MGTRSPLTLLALLGLCLQGCATPGLPANSSVCGVPEFAYSDGWLGGDAAYSVPLGTGRSLWLFGDTFVGSGDQDTRAGAHFVHNSIAISECRAGGEWEIEYFWTRAREDQPPGAFLATAERDRYWWLFGGLLHQSVLYLGLLEVEQSEPRGRLNLPFRYTGMKLARVANPDAPPAQWEIDVLPLSSNPIAFPASAMAVDGNHLYLFTFIDRDATRYPRILTRLPLEALTRETRDLSGRLETLTRGGTWQPGLDV
ncbi:MAG: hypothetical protein GY944_13345, partial [bacterium]|nr:hypothetical protein [bacterium]